MRSWNSAAEAAPARATRTKRWLRLGAQIASLILFALVLIWAGPEAWRQVAAGDPGRLVVALLLLGLAGMVSALRLEVLARAIAAQPLPPWPRFYHLIMTARVLGLFVPRTVSILGGKSVGLIALGVPWRRAAWIVLVDNALDLGLMAALAAPVLILARQGKASALLVVVIAGALLLLAGGVWWVTGPGRWRVLAGWANRLLSRLRVPLVLDEALDPVPRAAALRALGLSVVLNTALAFCYAQIARAVGLRGSWPVLAGFPITQLSLVIAFTPGALGVFDASWYGVLSFLGAARQDALNFVVAQRAYVFVFVLLWAGVSALLSFLSEKRARPGRPHAGPGPAP